jgi:hypothetical protein
VKSFLAVPKNYPLNGVLLNTCDDFIMIRNLGHEPDWRRNNHEDGQEKDAKQRIVSLDQFGPAGRSKLETP